MVDHSVVTDTIQKFDVGITFGAFDLFHAGHVIFFDECKLRCKYLIVGLHTDPSIERKGKNKPVQSVLERHIQLSGCKFVDEIIPYDTELDLENILKTHYIDVRFLGDEYLTKQITAQQYCIDHNIELSYIPRTHSYSSTELRNRILKCK